MYPAAWALDNILHTITLKPFGVAMVLSMACLTSSDSRVTGNGSCIAIMEVSKCKHT